MELKDGLRSLVRIDFGGRVHKQFRGSQARERCENEIRILRALEDRGCLHVPRLLEHDIGQLTIVTSNCGKPVEAIPQAKVTALFHELEQVYGVRHDDAADRNITYDARAGRFCIIDFELAELLPLPSPQSGPSIVHRIRWAVGSDRGAHHAGNEDAWLVLELDGLRGRRLGDHGERFLETPLLFAVADGMGGGRAGELASRLVLAGIRRKVHRLALDQSAHWRRQLEELIKEAHRDLNAFAQRDPKLEGMGCTLTLGLFYEQRVLVGHLGDSRLYLWREGETSQISRDHTFAFAAWKRGEMQEYAYRQHPRRSALYEAIGGGRERVSPLVLEFPSLPGDRYLLCTDGIIDGLWEEQIARFLTQPPPTETVRDDLMVKARAGDRSDDATALLVDFAYRNA
ncbi:MAG: protein phosphatase 2C domain-containing protein [Verrucomicrobiota bacterium]